jgi:DNA-binding response OmpR family regulator
VVSSHPNSEGEGDVLLVSDEATVRNEVSSVVEGLGFGVHELALGAGVTPAVQRHPYRLAILDLQIGNMGGMATCMDLRLEESGGRLPHVPVLMLLDRRADVFLARRSGAEGWVVKPLDPIRLRKAVKAVLAGAAYHDRSFQPVPSSTGG